MTRLNSFHTNKEIDNQFLAPEIKNFKIDNNIKNVSDSEADLYSMALVGFHMLFGYNTDINMLIEKYC